jgi:hypothetical protein
MPGLSAVRVLEEHAVRFEIPASRGAINRGHCPAIWSRAFGVAGAAGGWSPARHIRAVVDVNGDKRADLVGFYDKNVIVATAGAASFEDPWSWSTGYDVADGWTVAENPRLLAPMDSAPGADIVGFGDDGVHMTSLAIPIVKPEKRTP